MSSFPPPRPETRRSARPAHPGPWVVGILLGATTLVLGILTIPAAQPALADDPPRRLGAYVYGLPVFSLLLLAFSIYMVIWAGRRWRTYRAATTPEQRRADLVSDLRASKIGPPILFASLSLAALLGIAYPVWMTIQSGSAQILLTGQLVLGLLTALVLSTRHLLRAAWARSTRL